MNSIDCPTCRKLLYLPPSSLCSTAMTEVICRHCQTKYLVEYCHAKSFSSSLELSPQSNSEQLQYKQRRYQLQTNSSIDRVNNIEFSTAVTEQIFDAAPDDPLVLIYANKKNNSQKLIWLANLKTNFYYQLFYPQQQARSMGIKTTLYGLVGGLSLSPLSWLTPKISILNALAGTAIVAISSGWYIAQYHRLKYKESNLETAKKLIYEQTIFAEITRLQQRITDLQTEQIAEQNLITRFQKLIDKMRDTDADLYANRIKTLIRGVNAIKKQISLNQKIIEGYYRLNNIWEIEYETTQLVDQIPAENIEARVGDRLQELEALEQQKQQLDTLVEPAKLLEG